MVFFLALHVFLYGRDRSGPLCGVLVSGLFVAGWGFGGRRVVLAAAVGVTPEV